MNPGEYWWLYESKIDPKKLETPEDKWGSLYNKL